MKKSINILVFLFITIFFMQCSSETVDLSLIEKRKGVYYYKLKPDIPFTGYAVEYRKKTNIKRQDHEYKNGVLIHRILYDTDIAGRIWKESYFTDEGKNKEGVIYDVNYKNHNGYYGKLTEMVCHSNGKVSKEKFYETNTEENKLINTINYNNNGKKLKEEGVLGSLNFTIEYENLKAIYKINDKVVTEEEFKSQISNQNNNISKNDIKPIEENNTKPIEENNLNHEKTQKEQLPENLEIIGKNIWIRSEPTTGAVIMKLNTGNKCKLIEKGKQETIKDNTDFWYKISFNDKIGWVFGTQTNIKQ